MPRWLWVYGAVVAIALMSLGGWLLLELRDPSGPSVPSTADLAAAGCTADTTQPDLGGGHLGPEEMVNSAPSLIYPDQPPSSGPHIGQVVRSGVFDVVVDPRITTHNLEHGYVVVWYDVDTSPEDLAALRAWAEAGLAGDYPKLVVAEYPIRLPEDADVVLTAWFQRQACEGFDTAAADAFLRAHYDTFGEAPERGLPPHVSSGNGVLDPEGQDLVLPPLDDIN